MTTPETQEVSTGITEDQAAQAMLARWATPDDKAEPTKAETSEEPEAEQAEEATADADGETQAEADESDDGEEFDFGGEKIRVSKDVAPEVRKVQAKFKELESGSTRKFQEAAELRKVAESRLETAEQVESIGRELIDLIADHRMVERRLQALAQIDVNALGDADPVQLTKLNAEFNQLQAAKQRIEKAYSDKSQEKKGKLDELSEKTVAQLDDFAKRNIKGWGAEYSNKLMAFAVEELGFDPARLRKSINEPLIKAIDLAYQGHKVRTADPKAKQIVTTKTLKPGGAGAKQTVHATAEKARTQLAKSGRVEDAAMLLLARANTRKR